MGVVFRAHELQLNRRVAIKFLRDKAESGSSADPADDGRLRFLQEARAFASLSHPGITTIYAIGEKEGTPYIAMEWLEGRTLEQVLAEQGHLTVARAIELGIELLDALEAAHRAGVVHRDIKPSNLIVLADGRLKIMDFGIARVRDSDIIKTQPGLVLATPRFASPEQLSGAEVDGRSDLFSAAVVLYLAVSGRFPFPGRSFVELATAMSLSKAAPLNSHATGASFELSEILARALSTDREKRFESAREMADALRRIAPASLSTLSAGASSLAAFEGGESLSTYVSEAVEGSQSTSSVRQRISWDVVAGTIETWPSQSLGRGSASEALERLLERPLHAPAFSGAARFGSTTVLIEDGLVLGACDTATGTQGDEAVEGISGPAEIAIHPVPPYLPREVVALLAQLPGSPESIRDELDSSIVNLARLAEKLNRESFTGIVRLRNGAPEAAVLYVTGQAVTTIYSAGWDGVAVTTRWAEWASRLAVTVSVEARSSEPLYCSYKSLLAGRRLVVAAPREVRGTQSVLRRESRDLSRGARVSAVPCMEAGRSRCREASGDFIAGDPIVRFLEWSLSELPAYFRERERVARWRYLADWLAEIRGASIHVGLERPASADVDPFDLVTYDDTGKVLHVATRVARATAGNLVDFRDRVMDAKTARHATGDIGGALLVAGSFDDDALEAYRSATRQDATTRSLLGFEERLTRYEGFVRLGPRRGFHLLLVAETPTGYEPLLPDSSLG